MGPRGPKHYFFGDQFYSKNARKLRSHVFVHFYAGKHMTTIILPDVVRMRKKLRTLFLFSSGPRGPIIETIFTIASEFYPHYVKLSYYMFSSMAMEEYMESEFTGIF